MYLICCKTARGLVLVPISCKTEEEAITIAKRRAQRNSEEYHVFRHVGTAKQVETPVEFVRADV